MSRRRPEAEAKESSAAREAEASGRGTGEGAGRAPRRTPTRHGGTEAALAELVSRVVERGVVITGDLVVSVAGVDLLYVGLDVLLSATDRLDGSRNGETETEGGPGEEDDPGAGDDG